MKKSFPQKYTKHLFMEIFLLKKNTSAEPRESQPPHAPPNLQSTKNIYISDTKKTIATSIWNRKKKKIFRRLRFDTVINFFVLLLLLLIPSLIISMYGYIEHPLFAAASTS